MTQSRWLTLLVLFVSLKTSLVDGDTSLLRKLLLPDDRAQAPEADVVSIPVIPLPAAVLHAHQHPTKPNAPPSPLITHVTTPETTTPTTNNTVTDVKVPLVFENSYQSDDGSYLFEFEAANSVARKEEGYTKHENGVDILVKKGRYEFTSPEGVHFRVDYQADEKGYRVLEDRFFCSNKK